MDNTTLEAEATAVGNAEAIRLFNNGMLPLEDVNQAAKWIAHGYQLRRDGAGRFEARVDPNTVARATASLMHADDAARTDFDCRR